MDIFRTLFRSTAVAVAGAASLTVFLAPGPVAAAAPALDVGVSGVCVDDAVRFTLTGFAANPLDDVAVTWTLGSGGTEVDTVPSWVGEQTVSTDVPLGQTVRVTVVLPGDGEVYASPMLLADAEQCGSIPEPAFEISAGQRCDDGTARVAVEVRNTSLQFVSLDKQYWYDGVLLSTETVTVDPGATEEFTASPAGSRLVFTPLGEPGSVLADTGTVTAAICNDPVIDAGDAGDGPTAGGSAGPQLPTTGSAATLAWTAALLLAAGAALVRCAGAGRRRSGGQANCNSVSVPR